MKVAIIADSHFDETSRFEECIRLHDWILADMGERGVDLVLHAGDVYERRSTPRERAAVADWVQRVTTLAPLVIVRGNHDALGDLALLERLDTDHPVHVVEGAHVVPVHIGRDLDDVVAVACLAWPRAAELARAGVSAGDALRAVLTGMGVALAAHTAGPRILLAHAMVTGSVTSTGQPLTGCDMELGLADLGLAGADLYALGHIHLGQEWTWNGAPVIYPGSPRRTAFGELEAKGYIVAEFGGVDGHAVTWERVEVPATPMVHLEGAWVAGAWRVFQDLPIQGAEVRIRYGVTSDEREAGRVAALAWRDELLAKGAASVKVEEVVSVTQRTRAPEIAEAVTLDAKLQAYWTARQIEIDDGRRGRVLERLHSIEGDAA